MASKIQNEQVTQASASSLDCVPGVTCGSAELAVATPKLEDITEPTKPEDVPAYVEKCWLLSPWARACYRTKENAIRQITEVLERDRKENA